MSFLARLRASDEVIIFVVGLALFTDLVASGLIIPLLPMYERRYHVDTLQLGVLMAIFSVSCVLMMPIVGMLADLPSIGKKLPLLTGLFFMATSSILFAFANQFWQLIVARAVQGLSASTAWVCGNSLLAETIPADQFGRASSIVRTWIYLGMGLGPVIGGFLYEYVSYLSVFIFLACLALLDFLARIFLIDDEEVSKKVSANNRGLKKAAYNPRHTYLSLLHIPTLTLTVIASFLLASVSSSLQIILPLYLTNKFQADPSSIGIALFCLFLPQFLLCYPYGVILDKKIMESSTMMMIGLLTMSVVVVLLCLAPSMEVETLFLILLGVGLCSTQIPINPLIASSLRESGRHDSMARGFSLMSTAFNMGMVTGSLFVGLSVLISFELCTVILSAACVPVFLAFMYVKQRRMADPKYGILSEEDEETGKGFGDAHAEQYEHLISH